MHGHLLNNMRAPTRTSAPFSLQTMGDARAAEYMRGRRMLEVNPQHPIIQSLKAKVELESRCVINMRASFVVGHAPLARLFGTCAPRVRMCLGLQQSLGNDGGSPCRLVKSYNLALHACASPRARMRGCTGDARLPRRAAAAAAAAVPRVASLTVAVDKSVLCQLLSTLQGGQAQAQLCTLTIVFLASPPVLHQLPLTVHLLLHLRREAKEQVQLLFEAALLAGGCSPHRPMACAALASLCALCRCCALCCGLHLHAWRDRHGGVWRDRRATHAALSTPWRGSAPLPATAGAHVPAPNGVALACSNRRLRPSQLCERRRLCDREPPRLCRPHLLPHGGSLRCRCLLRQRQQRQQLRSTHG